MHAKSPHGFYGLPPPGASDQPSANEIRAPALSDTLFDIAAVIPARLANPLAMSAAHTR
jgi:hypothetical protein